MNVIQRPIIVRSAQIVVNGAAWRQVLGDIAPLATGPEELHQAIHHLADVDRPLVATALGWRDQRFNQRPLRVG